MGTVELRIECDIFNYELNNASILENDHVNWFCNAFIQLEMVSQY
ncbi:MAG: hypothetical protein ACJASH_001368 [Bermanella sp.]|jgi:hypothetical protein